MNGVGDAAGNGVCVSLDGEGVRAGVNLAVAGGSDVWRTVAGVGEAWSVGRGVASKEAGIAGLQAEVRTSRKMINVVEMRIAISPDG
jgi:hypothetical protein